MRACIVFKYILYDLFLFFSDWSIGPKLTKDKLKMLSRVFLVILFAVFVVSTPVEKDDFEGKQEKFLEFFI